MSTEYKRPPLHPSSSDLRSYSTVVLISRSFSGPLPLSSLLFLFFTAIICYGIVYLTRRYPAPAQSALLKRGVLSLTLSRAFVSIYFFRMFCVLFPTAYFMRCFAVAIRQGIKRLVTRNLERWFSICFEKEMLCIIEYFVFNVLDLPSRYSRIGGWHLSLVT